MLPENKIESTTVTIEGVECALECALECARGILRSVSASQICEGKDMTKEKFLSTYIQEFPKSAGLPRDFMVVDKEVVCHTKDRKPKRLDLLGYSEGTSLLYAVEVQAGKGDSDHINRTIFYAKNVKQRLEEIMEENKGTLGDVNISDENVVEVLVCEETPEEFDTDIADDNGLTVVVVRLVQGDNAVLFRLPPIFVTGSANRLETLPVKISSESSLQWHKPRAKKFFDDANAKVKKTFPTKFEETKGGTAMSALVGFTNGMKCTVGFWCDGGKKRRCENQVYLYGIPPEIFKAWDALGVNYRTGEQVVRLVGRASERRGLIIQLDEKKHTIWAQHFADAVQWVNENRGRRS